MIKVENGNVRAQAIPANGGYAVVEPGETATIDSEMPDEQRVKAFEAMGVKITTAKPTKQAAKPQE